MHFKPKAQQRRRLAAQQLSDDQLQELAPAAVATGKKLQNMAATPAVARGHRSSPGSGWPDGHLRNQRAMELAGELRDAIRGDPVTEEVAGHADLAAAAAAQNRLPEL